MRTRRLALAMETLTELRTEDLADVMGAAQQITPAVQCEENVTSKVVNCYTIFNPCPTR
jgi:hypothetical protein